MIYSIPKINPSTPNPLAPDDPAKWPHALKMERWKDFALRMAKTQYKKRSLRSLIVRKKESDREKLDVSPDNMIGKKYRHFKGQVYEVYATSIATKDYRKNDLVTPRIPYDAWTAFNNVPFNAWAESPISEGDTIVFYTKESGSGQLCWARSLHNFAETLEIKRFTEIEE